MSKVEGETQSKSKVKVSIKADENKWRDNLTDEPQKLADKANKNTKNICNAQMESHVRCSLLKKLSR